MLLLSAGNIMIAISYDQSNKVLLNRKIIAEFQMGGPKIVGLYLGGPKNRRNWQWHPVLKLRPTEIRVDKNWSHRGVCEQNLQTRDLKNGDDKYNTLVPIFCAGHVGIYQINFIESGNQSDVNIALSELT